MGTQENTTLQLQTQPEQEHDDLDTDEDVQELEEQPEKVEKWKKHYSSSHRILLVGEGDFSFSLCLARAFGSAHNLVATSLDSQENIEKKYRNGISNVRELEERGCLVLYGVDAKEMSQHLFLLRKEGGEIHVTHKEGDPYDKWDLVKRGLVLHQTVPFFKDDYPGYDNKRAHGKFCDHSFSIGESSTYKFKLQTSL